MKDLYNYISEGLLRGMEDTLDAGEGDVKRILIEDWLKEYTKSFHITLYQYNLDDSITPDNRIMLSALNPWYAYSDKEMQLPVPDYIDIKYCKSLTMHMKTPQDLSELPKIDLCSNVLIKPFSNTKINLDLSNMPIKTIDMIDWVYDNCNITKWPKQINTLKMWQFTQPSSCFGHPRYMIGFDCLKGLNCNNLIIPDIIFSDTINLINKTRWTVDVTIPFDSDTGKKLLKLYANKSIKFKELYVYTVAGGYKYRKVKKGKDAFTVSKRAKNFDN